MIPHPIQQVLEDAIVNEVGWHLPSPEHARFQYLFKALDVDQLNATHFVTALEALFKEEPEWLQENQQWPMLTAVFNYLDQLNEKEKDWQGKIGDLAEKLYPLYLTLNAQGTVMALNGVWSCPSEVRAVTAPWVSDELLVDPEWWKAAPAVLRERIDSYTPADLADQLKSATNISQLIKEGWPIQQAYTFLKGDHRLGGQLLRSLPIYRTTAGEYGVAEEMVIPDQVDDPFHVKKLLDVSSLKGHDDLLDRLNLARLEPMTYYGKLLPDYFRANPGSRRAVIEAVSREYAKHTFLVEVWKELECAELKGGKWVKPETAYWPSDLMTSLFGNEYRQFATDAYQGMGVKPFMETMGMRLTVSDTDIRNELSRRQNHPVTSQEIALRQKIFNHALGSATPTLSTYLSKLAWMPAQGSSGWHCPEELLTAEDAELVGQRLGGKKVSALRLLEASSRSGQNLDAMKFARPNPEQVIAHVRDLNDRNQGPPSRILKWLNRRAESLTSIQRGALRTLRIFTLSDGHFAAATHVFREDPNLGRWRFRVGAFERDKYDALLSALSVADRPIPITYRDVLLDIAGAYSDGETPSKDDQSIAETCIKTLSDAYEKDPERIQELIDSLRGKRVVPVLGKEGGSPTLLRPENAILRDKPKAELQKFNLPEHIEVLTRNVGTHGFWDEMGVRRISAVWYVSYKFPEGALRLLPDLSQKLKRMISPLLRIALKVNRNSSVNTLQEEYLQYQFFRCDRVPTTVELRGFRIVGQCDLEYAADLEEKRLYVRDLTPTYTVKVLAEMMGITDPADRMALDAIWSKSPEDAEDHLTEFQFPELPEDYEPVIIPSSATAITDDTKENEDDEEDIPADDEGDEAPPKSDSSQNQGSEGRKKHEPAPSGQLGGTSGAGTSRPSTPNGTGKGTPASDQPPRPRQPDTDPNPHAGQQRGQRPEGAQSPRGRRSSHSPSQQTRFRNYTYVYEGPEEDEAENHAREVDQRGMAFVMEYERKNGRNPLDESSDYGAGFDILSADSDGVVRYIELKTMSGPWRERGVALSANQYALARREKGNFWLYVVENLNTDPALYMFQNPFERVTSYTFDQSWKENPSTEDEITLGE